MVYFKAFRWVAVLLVGIGLSLGFQTPSLTDSPCGSWQVETSKEEKRIKITPITESSGTDCHGAFRFSNETGLWVLGGYTLDLTLPRSDNAQGAWAPYIGVPHEAVFLTPSLDVELHVTPTDISSEGRVSTQGEMTLSAVAIDTSLFLLKGALALAPAGTCVVPEEQLVFTAISVASIVRTAAERALQWDFVGVAQELLQIKDEFFEQTAAILSEIGADCGAEFIAREILKKPAIVGKLIVDYITWVPVAIIDYFKYEGRPAKVEFTYNIPEPPLGEIAGEIAYVQNGDIWLINLETGQNERLTTDGLNSNPTWSADGRYLIYEHFHRPRRGDYGYDYGVKGDDSGRPTGDLYMLDIQEGKRWIFSKDACCASWSPYGDAIAFISYTDNNLQVTQLDGSERKVLDPNIFNVGLSSHPYDLVWSPENKLYISLDVLEQKSDRFTLGSHKIWIYDIDTATLYPEAQLPKSLGLGSLLLPEGCFLNPAVSPDGRFLAVTWDSRCAGYAPGGLSVFLRDSSGAWQNIGYMSANLSWSPDGTWVAFESFTALEDTPGAFRLEGISIQNLATQERKLVVQDGWDPAWRPTTKVKYEEPIACAIALGQTFGGAWTTYKLEQGLGCPLNEERGVITAYQPFENGFMIWRQDSRHIYAIYDGGTWQDFDDTWKEGQPEYTCPDAATPSRTPPTPHRGLGKVWCTQPGVRERLGPARNDEIGDWRLVQDFQNGAMLFIQELNDKVYILFKDSHQWIED